MTMVIVKNQLLGDLDIYFYRIYSAVNNDLDVSYCNQLLQQNFSYYALSNYSSYHFSSLLPCLGHMVLVTTKRNTPKRNNTTLFSRSDGFLNSYPTPSGDCHSKNFIYIPPLCCLHAIHNLPARLCLSRGTLGLTLGQTLSPTLLLGTLRFGTFIHTL